MKIVATIEARMASSRLPGKVLLPVMDKPILYFLVQRLKSVPSIDEIVLATTTREDDKCLEEFAKAQEISVFRGSEDNVMQRVLQAAHSVDADIIVEITGDCPIIDPNIVEHAIQTFLANKFDYLSNALKDTYPVGMATQVFSVETLEKSYNMTSHPLDLEHVTRHICMHPELFSQFNMVAPPDCNMPECEVTLDELDDYELIKNIIEYFGEDQNFSCQALIKLLKETHPHWLEINKKVKRKGMDD